MNRGEDSVPYEDDVVAYVLGELADADRARFERALADDSRLAAEVENTRRVLAVLPAATAVVPPPALRERVLTAVLADQGEGGAT